MEKINLQCTECGAGSAFKNNVGFFIRQKKTLYNFYVLSTLSMCTCFFFRLLPGSLAQAFCGELATVLQCVTAFSCNLRLTPRCLNQLSVGA